MAASRIAAAVQRIAIEAERQRFTLRQTRRTVPITFSIMLVQASERRSSFGNPILSHSRFVSYRHKLLKGRCPACLLNIAKRSLPELILSGVGLASNDAVA